MRSTSRLSRCSSRARTQSATPSRGAWTRNEQKWTKFTSLTWNTKRNNIHRTFSNKRSFWSRKLNILKSNWVIRLNLRLFLINYNNELLMSVRSSKAILSKEMMNSKRENKTYSRMSEKFKRNWILILL